MTIPGGRHLDDEELILHHYGEAEAADRAAAHLESCDRCRDALTVLRRVLAAVDEASEVPERGPGYAEVVLERLRPRLEPAAPWPFRRRLRPLLALAATIVLAFLLGRLTSPPRVVERPGPGPVRERVLLVAVGDHLERSRLVLVELTHAEGGADVSIALGRERARDLVADNRLYRQTAEHNGQLGVASVLDELERVLLELANSPDTITREHLAQLVDRVEARGILFKVTVLGNQVHERQRALVHEASQS
jgi:hypothetical protein